MSYAIFLFVNLCLLVTGGLGFYGSKAISVGLMVAHPDWIFLNEHSESIISEFSMALVISAFLNVMVEWNTRRRHEILENGVIDRLNSETAKYSLLRVFNENLPQSVVAQIKAHLLSGHVCKRKWQAKYEFKIVDLREPPHRIVVWKATDTYVLYNMDREKRYHQIEIEAVPVAGEYRKYWDMPKLMVAGSDVSCTEHQDNRSIRISHEVKLKAGEEVSVVTEQTGAGPLEFHEVICSLLPVDEFEVTVEMPSELDVNAMSMHPDTEELIDDTPEKKTWRLCGILPGQGMDILWKQS